MAKDLSGPSKSFIAAHPYFAVPQTNALETRHRSFDTGGESAVSGSLLLSEPFAGSTAEVGSKRDAPSQAETARKNVRTSDSLRRAALLSDTTLNSALCGDAIAPGGAAVPHSSLKCSHLLSNGQPCWHNLWPGSRDQLRKDRTAFLDLSQEARSTLVFHKLQEMWYAAPTAETKEEGPPKWHLAVRGRPVCQHTFLLAYPISSAQLGILKARVVNGLQTAHDKTESCEAKAGEDTAHSSRAQMGVVGWYHSYAEQVGDVMPDEQQIITPRRERKDEYDEYEAALGTKDAVHYSTFCQVLREHPLMQNIKQARWLANFQGCTTCVTSNNSVKAALASGDRQRIIDSKAKRRAHINLTRCERLHYYQRRERGRDPSDDSISIIIDKMDSDKTTVPWFVRSPGGWWAKLKKNVLQEHLLGVLVHGRPNRQYIFAANDSIKGDANLNIEGLRRMLVQEFASKPMPRVIYLQADNASDNKCWAMVTFLAMLVFHGYIEEAFLSFLIVGHTHEDIDQLFSIISRFFRNLTQVLHPADFLREVAAALASRPVQVSQVESVFRWDEWLRRHLVKPLPVGLQHATLKGAEGEKDEVRSPHTFWIHRRSDGRVIMHYKEFCAHQVWLPHVQESNAGAALVTDERGIQLFATDPPDPVNSPPRVARLEC